MTGFRISPHPGLVVDMPESYVSMGQTAENVVAKYGVSRADMDEFAYHSHRKAGEAQAAGRFKDEIAPVAVTTTTLDGTRTSSFEVDELVRRTRRSRRWPG